MPLNHLILAAVAVMVLAGDPTFGSPARVALTRIKSAPGLECPCALSTVPRLKRGLVHTVVLTGSGLGNAGLVLAPTGIVGRVVLKSDSEVTLTLTLAADAPLLARPITLMAGPDNLGAFTVQPVSLGRVDSVTPTQIPAGTRTVVTVSGRDIESAAFQAPEIAARTIVERQPNLVRVALTPPATSTRLMLPLGENVAGAFLPWRTLEVSVQATVATGDSGCQPMPATYEVRGPTLEAPSNGFLFDPLTGSQTQRQVTFRWRPPSPGGDIEPDRAHILEYRVAAAPAWTTRTVAGTATAPSTSAQVNLPRARYEWRVRSFNCGQPASYSQTWGFEIR